MTYISTRGNKLLKSRRVAMKNIIIHIFDEKEKNVVAVKVSTKHLKVKSIEGLGLIIIEAYKALKKANIQ